MHVAHAEPAPPAPEGTPPGTAAPASSRPLRVATVLQAVAAAGNGLAYVALSLRVYQETHSTLAVTAVLLAGGLPVVVLAPVSGHLLDRLPMGRLLAAASLLVAVALVGLAFSHALWEIIVLVLAFGVADSVLQPGLTAAVPHLAGDVPLARATSRLQAASMGGTAAGPLLAGVVGSIGGTTTALLLDAAAAVVFTVGVRTLGLDRTRRPPAGADDGMAAGLRYLRRDRPLGLLVLVISAVIAFIGVTMVVELFLAERVLHGGTTGFALLITAWTGGMTLGTVVAGRLSPRALAPGVVIGLAVLGMGIAAGALAPAMWIAIAGVRPRRGGRRGADGRCPHAALAARPAAHRRASLRGVHRRHHGGRVDRPGRGVAPGHAARRPRRAPLRRGGRLGGRRRGPGPGAAPPPGRTRGGGGPDVSSRRARSSRRGPRGRPPRGRGRRRFPL